MAEEPVTQPEDTSGAAEAIVILGGDLELAVSKVEIMRTTTTGEKQ